MPALVVLRGNSGAGKSTISQELLRRSSRRIALVEQDYVRRVVLRESGDVSAAGDHVTLIETMAQHAMTHGYSALVEGILFSDRCREMLIRLRDEHDGPSHFFYVDVPFDETVLRHETRPQATDFTAAEMRDWYHPQDSLGLPEEHRLDADSSLDASVARVLEVTGWGRE